MATGPNWDDCNIVAIPGYDFATAVKAACSPEEAYGDDLFSPSPPPTPNSTPPPSPILQPMQIPTKPGEAGTLVAVKDLFRLSAPTTAPPFLNMPATHPPVPRAAFESLDGRLTTTAVSMKRKRPCSYDEGRKELGAAHLSSSTNPAAPTTSRKGRKREKARANRQQKREREQAAAFGPAPREKARKKYAESADLLFMDLNLRQMKVTSTAYTALDDRVRIKKTYTVDELVGEGSPWKFRLKKWDGKYVIAIIFGARTSKNHHPQNDDSPGRP